MTCRVLSLGSCVLVMLAWGCGGGGGAADASSSGAEASAGAEVTGGTDGTDPDGADDDTGSGAPAADAADSVSADDAARSGDVEGADGVALEDPLTRGLPFDLTRPPAGEPMTDAEITEFTQQITGFWKDTQYWRWVRMISHGLDPSNPMGQFDYALWWQDTRMVKADGVVTFEHYGRADNLTLRTCKVLSNALAGYLMFGDEHLRWLSEQYSRGLAALSKAMVWGEDDDVLFLQARALFTHDHTYESVDGRQAAVDYSDVRRDEESWNAAIVRNESNPTWGDIWVVNQRSKDDVPHMWRVVPMLMRAAVLAPDESVREAAALALETMQGFAQDILDSGYQIRTKFEDGEAVVPTKEDGTIKDLASFVLFEAFVPNGECTTKLGTAYIAQGEDLGNACGAGDGQEYEAIATTQHYFNYAIIRFFHIAAASNALMLGEDETAHELLVGLGERADRILHDDTLPHYDTGVWWPDAAAFLLAAAAAGMPLTDEEARLIRDQYVISAEHYGPYDKWDPWDDSVADGSFEYKPDRGPAVRPTELGYLLEYCYSPHRNPAGARVVDCDVIADPTRWGGP